MTGVRSQRRPTRVPGALELACITAVATIVSCTPGVDGTGAIGPGGPARTIPPARDREPLAGAAFTIVHEGIPTASLVVASGSDTLAADQAAATLLQDWIAFATGARLEIVAEPGDLAPIYVGSAALAAGLRLDDIKSRSAEGLRVRVESDRILLGGQSGNARTKAAAVLLEELGCRWYMEGELGRHCPVTTTFTLDPVQITDEPGFLYRRIWSADGWSADTPWKAWNGSGGLALNMQHAWREIAEGDFEEHPDWFALDASGERVRGPWLNTGSVELRRVFAERLIAATAPGTHPSISPPDRHRADYSPESMRHDDPRALEPSSGRVSMSNRFIDFANDIAGRVAEQHPNAILGFHAYSDYSQPPTRIAAVAPNICVWIAPIRFSRFHRLGAPNSPSRQQLVQVIDGWSRKATMLGYRTYNYNLGESMTPFSKVTTWTHDIPYLAGRNFVGMSIESFPTWDLSAPTLYLSIRLAYDPTADANAILADFYSGFYGAAAAPMQEYWEDVDRGWQSLATESGSIYSVHLVFSEDRLRRLDAALERAERSVVDDPVRRERVVMARTGYLSARDFVTVRDALAAGDVELAQTAYASWEERTEASIARGHGHRYNATYLRRYVGRPVRAFNEALVPPGAGPRDLVAVLPDRMRMAYARDLDDSGGGGEPLAPEVFGADWQTVRTAGATLDQQGFADRLETMWYRTVLDTVGASDDRVFLHFAGIDGTSRIWVNGSPVETDDGQPREFPALEPFTAEITQLLRRSGNRLAVQVDHHVLRELSLGGIVAPIYVLRERVR